MYEPGNPFSYTFLGIELSPTLLAIGWFMKFRVAFLVNLGSIVAWFYLIPIVVVMDLPIYDPAAPMPGGGYGGYVPVTDYPLAQWKASSRIVRTVAI